MPIGESLNFNPDIPEFEAIIQNALPESLLKVTGKYMTSQVYDKTLTYKGKEYKPGPMQMVFVNETYLNVIAAPANYKFQVGGKTFQIGSDRKRITIISGGEPILWREAVADPQSYDPVDSVGIPLQGDECRITNGLAQTPFSYFYMTGGVGGILQSIPLQDGTVFRQRKPGGVPGSQSYAWYRFSKTNTGGIFREVDTVLDVYIATIKNIDFTKLGDLDAIIDAMDTVNGKPFDAKFFRDTKYRIEMAVLLNAQTDSRQNGIYFLSAVDGDNAASTISRVSPFLKWTYGYIGRTKVAVWQGDRFGQDEAWLSSDKAIGASGRDPRVHFDTTPHVWIKSRPEIEIEERVYANLEKIEKLEEELGKVSTGGVAVEADPVALAAVAELQETVDKLPTTATTDALGSSLKGVEGQLKTLDTSKANQADLDALKAAQAALKAALDALPASPTPAQLAAVEARVKALEGALSTAENSKGILTFDPRSHKLVAGNLFGGFRRLTQTDITGINERSGFGSTRPYAALNGSSTTDMSNASNQWLTWNFNQVRLWRIEMSLTNSGGWANRDLRRNAVKILDLNGNEGSHTDIYLPSAVAGHELANSIQIVDDGGNTVITNLYVSVTDSASPALPPTVNGTQLKVGDRFRLNNGDVSALFTYQGTDAATGAWKSTPVSSSADKNIALHTVIDPIFESHNNAITALETQVSELQTETLALRAEVNELKKRGIVVFSKSKPDDSDWGAWFEKDDSGKVVRLWHRDSAGEARPILVDPDRPFVTPTHATAIQPDPIGKPGEWRNSLPQGVTIDYTTTLNNLNQQAFAATFPVGILTRISFEAQDATGTALELGGLDIDPEATTLNLPPSAGNGAVTKIVWRIAYKDGSSTLYEVPVTR